MGPTGGSGRFDLGTGRQISWGERHVSLEALDARFQTLWQQALRDNKKKPEVCQRASRALPPRCILQSQGTVRNYGWGNGEGRSEGR